MPLRTSLLRKPTLSNRKEVLSVNMISLPLGDFRHLSHIGTDGHTDSFGDLSFLKAGQKRAEPVPPAATKAAPPQRGRREPVQPDLGTHGGQSEAEVQLASPLGYGGRRGRVFARRARRDQLDSGRDSTQTNIEETQPDQTDTSFTFSLDLGPSILDA
ncbi:hypothetical protein M9458_034050, partial [Cirrhinus mrigala]